MTALELTKKVRTLLTNRKNWMKNSFAKNAQGTSVSENAHDAVCFCLSGAFSNAAGSNHQKWADGYAEFRTVAARCRPDFAYIDPFSPSTFNTIGFNDDPATSHKDVLSLLDCTIAKLEAQNA